MFVSVTIMKTTLSPFSFIWEMEETILREEESFQKTIQLTKVLSLKGS